MGFVDSGGMPVVASQPIMQLSREKLVHLSHVIVDGLDEVPGVKYNQERNDVRLHILGVL